jgi:hypothetical protein
MQNIGFSLFPGLWYFSNSLHLALFPKEIYMVCLSVIKQALPTGKKGKIFASILHLL